MVPIVALSQVSSIIDGARDLVSLVRSGSSTSKSSTADKRLQAAFSNLMKEMDANNDGKLNRTEFGGEKSVFEKMDINHDGQLDAAEVHQMLAQRLSSSSAATASAATVASSQPTLSLRA